MNNGYIIEYNVSGCSFDFQINRLPFDRKKNLALKSEKLANRWLTKGLNNFNVQLLPIKVDTEIKDDAYFRIQIFRCQVVDGNLLNREEFLHFETPDFAEYRKTLNNTPLITYPLSGSFETELDYTNGIFDGFQQISPEKLEIEAFYKKVHGLFQDKNKKGLLDLMELRIKEYAKSVYRDIESEYERQDSILENMFSRSIFPLDLEKFQVLTYLDNKLFCLEDLKGNSPLKFRDEELEVFVYYPFYIGKSIQNGQWLIGF